MPCTPQSKGARRSGLPPLARAAAPQWIVMFPPESCPLSAYELKAMENRSVFPEEPLSTAVTWNVTFCVDPSACVHVAVPPQVAEFELTVGAVCVSATSLATSPPLSVNVRFPPPSLGSLNPKVARPPLCPAIEPPPVIFAPVPPTGPPLNEWQPSFGRPAMAPVVWCVNHAMPSPGVE